MERPKYQYFDTWSEHFRRMDEMFERERKRTAAFTREEAMQYLRDVGIFHLVVFPKKRTPWRTKSKRRKEKDTAKLKRLKRHK